MSGGSARTHGEMMDTDPTFWSQRDNALKEPRDLKELAFLCQALLALNQNNLARVCDMVVMRIRELRYAKSSGQSWDSAAVLSLVPNALPSTAPVPDAAFAL